MSRRWKTFSAPFILGAFLWCKPILAAGALAVGVPPDVAKQGFAAGHKVNAPTMDDARQKAIAGCRTSVDASEQAKKLCNVVATFSNQCIAIAIDPEAGTPGVGWAVAENQKLADAQALTQCRNTAGPSRGDFCIISDKGAGSRGCDGDAK